MVSLIVDRTFIVYDFVIYFPLTEALRNYPKHDTNRICLISYKKKTSFSLRNAIMYI